MYHIYFTYKWGGNIFNTEKPSQIGSHTAQGENGQ